MSDDADYREAVVNAIRDGAYVLDENRVRVFVNDRLRNVSGYGEDVLLSKHPERLVEEGYWSVETADRYRAAVDSVLSGASADERVRLSMTLGDGRSVTTETRLTPYRKDGETTGVIGVVRDVTEHVERERELERTNERLERVSGFLAHDLRNPINVAEGYVELAQETGDVERLGAAQDALDRIDELVTDVLGALRESREMDLTPVDAGALARDVWDSDGVDGSDGDADLIVESGGTVAADAALFRRVVVNLLGNALAHGGSSPTICVGVTDNAFYVADDGPGIPPKKREAAMAFGESIGESDGSGIGLALVVRVAELHDWTLDLTESADGGLRVTLDGAAREGATGSDDVANAAGRGSDPNAEPTS